MKGYCGCGPGYNIASICLHQGEEPPINGLHGICNIFFTGCNLQCIYCQNHQISKRRNITQFPEWSLEQVIQKIIFYLDQGVEALGFVSPTHHTPHVKAIIHELHSRGVHPVTVYNTNGYDRVDVLQQLEGIIDVYLPDFKYLDSSLSKRYSEAENYPEIARMALKEMFRQKGSTVVLNDNGQAVTGLIIRHLVLPGHVKDSISIMEWIAGELSPSVHISLMSQYYPAVSVPGYPELHRKISEQEYQEVVEAMEHLGFYRGWFQEPESSSAYRPDFNRGNPFKS